MEVLLEKKHAPVDELLETVFYAHNPEAACRWPNRSLV
jgi:hypothetical protein